jgi:hypothetical protein
MAYLEQARCKISKTLLSAMPHPGYKFHSSEWKAAGQNKFGAPQSKCIRLQGFPINNNNPRTGPATVDKFGHNLKTVNGIRGDGIRHFHDRIVNLFSKFLRSASIPHRGGRSGTTRTCGGLFNGVMQQGPNQASDEVTRLRQLIVPDIVICASAMPGTEFGNSDIMTDVKTLGPGTVYNVLHPESARNVRANKVNVDYHRAARNLDRALGTPEGQVGGVQAELNRYDGGRVQGLVVGAFGGVSDTIKNMLEKIAKEAALDYCRNFNVTPAVANGIIRNRMNQELGLCIHLGWAKLLLDRVRDFVLTPRGMAALPADDLDEDAAALRDHHHQFPDNRAQA